MVKGRCKHGKILIISFKDDEEQSFQHTLEWLSSTLDNEPSFIYKQTECFHIDIYKRTVISNGREIYLTAKEFDLLYFLYSHKGQVFTKEQLYEKIWGYEDVIDGSNLTSFIRKLRKKIEPVPDNPQYIITVWGVGYKFNEEKP